MALESWKELTAQLSKRNPISPQKSLSNIFRRNMALNSLVHHLSKHEVKLKRKIKKVVETTELKYAVAL